MKNIGFIGLGHMGQPMVKNLLRNQYRVKIYDIVADPIKDLVALGAIEANSPSDAASEADVVITSLQTADQVKSVCFGAEGIFAALSSESLFIDCSSIDIGTTRYLHAEGKKRNFAILDAPVSGGIKGAEQATLTIMVGGEESDFNRAKIILSCLGKNIIYSGPAGNGQAAKICNNMILGISMIAVSEAFVLAKKLGLNPSKFFEISSNASGQCWAMTSYCPVPNILENVPANHDYQPGFMAKMMLKDLILSQDAAKIAGVSTELGSHATRIYETFIEKSNGELDFSAIIKMIEMEN